MWTERQWRDRRIGTREILWSWTIVALIALGVAAWDGVRAILPELDQAAPTRVASDR
jgi:hypothetical protein